jgi:hypothetical protein
VRYCRTSLKIAPGFRKSQALSLPFLPSSPSFQVGTLPACYVSAVQRGLGNDAILKARPSTRRSIPVAIALDIERRFVVFGIRLPAYKRELMHFSLNSDWSFEIDALETPYPLG